MIKAILCGCSGKMGSFVAECAKKDAEIEITAGVDRVNNGQMFPVFSEFSQITNIQIHQSE